MAVVQAECRGLLQGVVRILSLKLTHVGIFIEYFIKKSYSDHIL